ncbi:lipopolysaccharide biosynthesis protein [Granulicella paludicola]|uniref:lipopolysaccharide biosynthesis protein n=1 Tax=Granulicella paludicola TaxID=474951 RepID=UPI0021E0318D|nr:lipopolysaccharide biosynthesis protein [Granulicella paludicola]
MGSEEESIALVSRERSAVQKRLAAGFGVNIFSRGVGTLIQVLSVPIFLKHWGAPLYGEWILLNSVPSYFALSDVGFGSTAGNEMTMLMAAGKQDEALEVFQSVLALTTVISAALCAVFLALVWFLPFQRWLHTYSISPHDTKLVILLLVLSTLLSMQETLYQAAFRCVAKYVYGTFLKSLILLGSFLAVSGTVLLGGSVLQTAEVYFGVNAVGTLLLWLALRREVPWLRFGFAHARWETLKRLLGPSLSFFAMPIGQAMNLTGILLVVGHVLGPVAVVVFSTARTVSRTAVQFMMMISNTIWPEMSIAVGAEDWELARSIHRRACQISTGVGVAIVAVMAAVGPWIWGHWTLHKVPTDTVLLDLMLLLVIFSSLWLTSITVLLATNRHQQITAIYLTVTSLTLAAAWPLSQHFGLRGAAVALIVCEMVLAATVLRTSLRFLGDNFGDFARSLFSVPKLKRTEVREEVA